MAFVHGCGWVGETYSDEVDAVASHLVAHHFGLHVLYLLHPLEDFIHRGTAGGHECALSIEALWVGRGRESGVNELLYFAWVGEWVGGWVGFVSLPDAGSP